MSIQILQQFSVHLKENLRFGNFLKLSLSNYRGNNRDLKNVYVRPVKIKRVEMLSFTYRYKTRDIFKNLSIEDGIADILHLISNDFKAANLFTSDCEISLQYNNKNVPLLREIKSNIVIAKPELSHNREKNRIIGASGKSYLTDLNITDVHGTVFKNAQDKYKQINQYIEILSSLIRKLPTSELKSVVDMGSGKGYLTFALYDYLHNVLKLSTSVVGVEYREDLVEFCNEIASRSKFDQLAFVRGAIEDYQINNIDILIALHACDTATDDAILKGIVSRANLIVVAPCCHKQIRKQMEVNRTKNELSALTRYGVFLERQAEMITDGLRALILEYFGYKTKVVEFVSDAHTPKNVLIIGIRDAVLPNPEKRSEILKKIQGMKAYFGIEYHYLEQVLGIDM